ncbi:hypothetical protein BB560_001600 [Smittium megazygosporum]|uniref:Calnexin n=1 Tax=Smittium megazygosporum TaxID=133381 RepID=A0A2T9Z301_9FUNG|nr:hypothetical protein BB560_005581 [Smittium megazygosporum]PVV03919.1 hypothetical protein BB560_001600 [Smittium megazygosporum]
MKVGYLFSVASLFCLAKVGHFCSAEEIDYANITPEIIKKYASNVTMDEFELFFPSHSLAPCIREYHPENAVLWEQFTEESFKKWVVSKAVKEENGMKIPKYPGVFSLEEPTVFKNMHDDLGLVLKTPAAHHAISRKFDKVFIPRGKPLVIQFEVKMQKPISCGGAYIKLLRGPPEKKEGEEETDVVDDTIKNFEEFDDKTPYTIMFGPDICDDKKVHFIINSYNPITKKFEEKQMTDRPQPRYDQLTHIYKLIVDLDNSYKIMIDNQVRKEGSLLTDFEPPINPPKEIDDPNDKKPDDWVEEKEIVDMNAVKPDDWDEDAPKYIEDKYALKPKDWNQDLPPTIPDPKAIKPQDWDDELDGTWEPPMIKNPACYKISGCGPYKYPLIKNPNYKGKWTPPMIRNPAYKGEWEPRKITNPDYFEIDFPCEFTPMAGVGIELWTMTPDILFDNIYIGTSEGEAVRLANEIWVKKYEKETEIENAIKFYETDKIARKEFKTVPPIYDLRHRARYYYYQYVGTLIDMFEITKESGVIAAVKEHPKASISTLAAVAYLAYLINSILYSIVSFIFVANSSAETPEADKDKSKKAKDSDKTVDEGKNHQKKD